MMVRISEITYPRSLDDSMVDRLMNSIAIQVESAFDELELLSAQFELDAVSTLSARSINEYLYEFDDLLITVHEIYPNGSQTEKILKFLIDYLSTDYK